MSIQLSPGPAGVELGYAEITANVTQTGLGSQDVAGLAVTVNVGARPIKIEFGCSSLACSSASGLAAVSINEGSTGLTNVTYGLTTVPAPVTRAVRLAPSAGAHTYKITLGQIITGNSVLGASSGGPAYIWVVEV